MKSHIRSFLAEMGLSSQESEAYEIALGLGTFAASTLGVRLGVPRSTARYACESLVKKGLMIETKKANTKLFIAENPTKLFSILYEQEAELARKKDQLSVTVKELQQKYNPEAKLPKITFYEGVDGIERMTEEMLDSTTELYSFGAGDYFLSKEPEMVKKFRSKSPKSFKKVNILRASKYKALHKDDGKSTHRYFQYIDELKIDIQITKDKLSIISLEESSPVGVLIKHQDIVNGFYQIFSELWNRASKDH